MLSLLLSIKYPPNIYISYVKRLNFLYEHPIYEMFVTFILSMHNYYIEYVNIFHGIIININRE